MRQKGDVLCLDLNSAYAGVFTKILSNCVYFCALSKCMLYFSKSLLKVEIKKDCHSCYQNKALTSTLLNILFYLSFIVAGNSDDILMNTLSEYHLALACAASAASSRHFAFFARFQLVKDSCRSAACRSKRRSILALWKNLYFRDT